MPIRRNNIRTKRLTLRPLSEEDASHIADLAGDWEVARMTARVPYPYQPHQAYEWIDGIAEGEFVRGIDAGGTLIGICGYLPKDDGCAEIGYWIGKPWWGNGYATEAVEALIRYCFRRARFTRLTCCHFVDNPASARVIEKLGFVPVGECMAWCDARRRTVETFTYELRRPKFGLLRRRTA